MKADLKAQMIESLPWCFIGMIGVAFMLRAQPELVIGYAIFCLGRNALKDIQKEWREKRSKAISNQK